MNKVLILYPLLFKCYSKFHRKIERIISRLDNVTLVFLNDPNNYIEQFVQEGNFMVGIEKLHKWTLDDISYAIIFDDGEEFPEKKAELEIKKIPLRYIFIPITRVININKETEYKSQKNSSDYAYIGRGSKWGNPYSIYEENELEKGESARDEVIRKFKYDFDNNKMLKQDRNQVFKLIGKRLGCFCKPESCHGDVIADFLNSWDDGK